ncbi:MAG: N-acetylglucosamine-6-phosphate deacetylase [Oscillospiraceae bacterium]
MIIKNSLVFRENCEFSKGDLFIENGKFSDSASGDIIDASDCYAIPGLVDIHFHGCVGHDFCDASAEGFEAMSVYEAQCGVTAICPATMSLSEETLTAVCLNAAASKGLTSGAELVGINMEGPFISMEKKGAQNPDFIVNPDAGMFERLQNVSGNLIKLCDIAPETEGAMEFIEKFSDGVVISLAHTTADYDTASEAIRRGASHITHLYNAMPPFSHRDPGVVGAALDGGCEVELIADGVHIHPSVVRATFNMFGSKVILISDSMMATGLDDGNYSLGGLPVTVRGNRATLEDGTIAGSATNLMDCVRTAVNVMGIPLEIAINAASANPAKSIGIYETRGSINVGKIADLVLLNKDLTINRVILRGNVYCR